MVARLDRGKDVPYSERDDDESIFVRQGHHVFNTGSRAGRVGLALVLLSVLGIVVLMLMSLPPSSPSPQAPASPVRLCIQDFAPALQSYLPKTGPNAPIYCTPTPTATHG